MVGIIVEQNISHRYPSLARSATGLALFYHTIDRRARAFSRVIVRWLVGTGAKVEYNGGA